MRYSSVMNQLSVYPLPLRTLRVTGPDRASWLHGIATGNILSAAEGQGIWSLLLNKVGKIQADLSVIEIGDALLLGMMSADVSEAHQLLDQFLVMEDAELEETEELSWYLLLDESEEELSSLPSAGDSWVRADISLGRGNAHLIVGLETEKEFQDLIAGFRLASENEWTDFRLRHKQPLFGVDFSQKDKPHDAGLERLTVDWTKGCYLGQEVVCMQDMRGKARKRLVLLKADNPLEGIQVGAELSNSEGDIVGSLTSVSGSLAFGTVKAPYETTGSLLKLGPHSVEVERLHQ